MAQVINTHQLFNKLKESGFDEQQAETVIDTIETIQVARLEDVTKKGDLVKVRNELKADVSTVDAKIDKFREELKGDMKVLQWGVALILAVVAMPLLKGLFS